MSKEKIVSLNKYLGGLKERLISPTPVKHLGNPDTYRQFLEREIRAVQLKLDAAKLEGVK